MYWKIFGDSKSALQISESKQLHKYWTGRSVWVGNPKFEQKTKFEIIRNNLEKLQRFLLREILKIKD